MNRLVAILVACCVAAAGCGGTSSGDKGSPSTTTASGETVTRPTTPGAVDALDIDGPTEVADAPAVAAPSKPATPNLPVTVTDARGTKVHVTRAKRVIALDLYATLTDTIIGLGLSDHLVGRAVSDTQEVLADLPTVSRDGLDLNTEAVLSLKPDLILTNLTIGNERTYQQLESAGITVVRFDQVPSIDGISSSIHEVGAVFGLADQADALSARTRAALVEAKAKVAALKSATPRNPRAIVLYVRGHSGVFFILGPDYGAADVISELGLEDVAGDSGITDLAPANAEALVSLDPEIILTMRDGVESAGGIDGLLSRPGVGETTAGRNRRVVTAADNQLLSYGPRTPANLVALATAIYTEDPGAR